MGFVQRISKAERLHENSCTVQQKIQWLCILLANQTDGALHDELSTTAFSNTHHIMVTTDGSTHGTKDLQVSVAFDSINDIAVPMTCQSLSVSKRVAPMEFDIHVDIERILARNEGERIKSYKLMQALSHQLSLLTSGKMNLETFLPLDCWAGLVTPLRPFCNRLVANDSESISIDGELFFPLHIAADVPLLTLLQDQGTINMAACSYMKSLQMMVHSDWDYYHRLSNDLKLAAEKCQMLQSQLAMQYVWSINYRPFGTGAFFQEKQEALEWFLNSYDADSGLDSGLVDCFVL